MSLLDKYSDKMDPIEELLDRKVQEKIEERNEEDAEESTHNDTKIKNKNEVKVDPYQENVNYVLSTLIDILTDVTDIIQMTSYRYGQNLNAPLLNLSRKLLSLRVELPKHQIVMKPEDKIKIINTKRRLDITIKTVIIPLLSNKDASLKIRLENLTK